MAKITLDEIIKMIEKRNSEDWKSSKLQKSKSSWDGFEHVPTGTTYFTNYKTNFSNFEIILTEIDDMALCGVTWEYYYELIVKNNKKTLAYFKEGENGKIEKIYYSLQNKIKKYKIQKAKQEKDSLIKKFKKQLEKE